MTTTARALQAPSAQAPLEPTTIERRDLGPTDVAIDVKFCGICHSDIHQVEGDWGRKLFPMVPGHEIAGVVTAVGSDVTRHAEGDRVGVGCFVDSCGACDSCQAGDEHFCAKGVVATYNGLDYDGERTLGGYSTHIVVDERFVLRIPDGLELDAAAPLLCAGITMYNPLKRWGAGPGKAVAIVGMGGLGHVGVQLAAAMGAEVTVLSQTLSKEADGRRFGASAYHATSDPSTFKSLRGRFDLILNTVSANLPLDAYLGLLKPRGAMVSVGLPTEPDTFHAGSLIGRDRVLSGSNVGGLPMHQEMLDFCAEHGVAPAIEVIGGDAVNEAYPRVVRSDVRYRFVIDVGTL
ncbi:MAG TPA: NAD(P)-dependent alcohol dehydrogenase [Baekduia sp.]|uniref:NAD(P)-dependent alcohol dehydrogenase n=1 Tax=Baekduia sp. TaxID=2600305 RepID=UPI002D7A107E|nr:NAD(P)-dependent alcohol dehydrogenase [Baekduia sp.]HET6505780.1 NAD(P)-dependent alcohol dehydrogenase [Baekduia sp.]